MQNYEKFLFLQSFRKCEITKSFYFCKVFVIVILYFVGIFSRKSKKNTDPAEYNFIYSRKISFIVTVFCIIPAYLLFVRPYVVSRIRLIAFFVLVSS